MLVEKPVVLIVDDISENILIASELLKPFYKVKAATNGDKALAICAAENPPDLVILDMVMPGLSGLEVCNRLQQSEQTKHIPILFMSAMDSEFEREQCLSAGAKDFVPKPIDPKQLIDCVNFYLPSNSSRKESN